jgi:hypothetical protein
MNFLEKLLGLRRHVGPYAFPLQRSQERDYGSGYEGDVFYWDIDKTYLESDHGSVKGLMAVTWEMAVDKRQVAATDVLLRALRRGAPSGGSVQSSPLYFVSASPPQLRTVIQRKMLMDGVEHDGITFKDQLALIRSGKLHRLRAHIAYKLSALLLYRREIPWTVRETLFGDDSESDALIYGLYADIVAGRLRGEELEATLRKNGALPEDALYVTDLSAGLPKRELVERIYIHLAPGRAKRDFSPWGAMVVPHEDTLQAALTLLDDGKIRERAVVEITRAMIERHDLGPAEILRRLFDVIDRGYARPGTLAGIWETLRTEHLVPESLILEERPSAPRVRTRDRDFVTPTKFLALGR